MAKVKVSTKGWVVIPVQIRKKYGIKPGSTLEIEDQGNFLLIKAEKKSKIDQLFGVLKDKKS